MRVRRHQFASVLLRTRVQHLADFACEGPWTIRLLDECDSGVQDTMAYDGIVGVTRGVQNPNAWPPDRDFLGKFRSPDFRHYNIGQQQVDSSFKLLGTLK